MTKPKPKLKFGDRVKCSNPTHPGNNPFDVCYSIEGFYYSGEDWSHISRLHDHGLTGCRESELEKCDGPAAK